MQEKEKDKFSFINERRKEKPINKRKLAIQAGFVVGMAVVFGLVASFVFAYTQPIFEQMLYPEAEPYVSIPRDDIGEVEDTEETDTTEPEETELAETGTEDLPADIDSTEDIEPPIQQIPRELEIADFQNVQNKLYAVGREANRFVVTVTAIKSDTDWFNNAYESRGQASGIIIADNGYELLVLTERKVISDAEVIYVTFINEATVEASMKKYDGNTGIAVLSIPHDGVDEETMNAISIATLGNSLVIPQGMMAIAVGSPLGTSYSILTGNITSTNNSVSVVDNNFTVFTTDIVGSSDGSGAIINIEGEVIGLVMQDYSSEGEQGTLTAISISELKAMIEKLSNGQDIPYIGLQLSTVTNDIAREYDIPKGAYIREVKMDSPGMAAGLQSGDIITQMGGEAVFTVDAYENRLLALAPDERVEIVVERQGTDGYREISCMVDVSILQ